VTRNELSAPPALNKWWVCGLLLLALMLNYMDRQTLSLTISSISHELKLTNTQYGQLEKGFGYAFAVGGLIAGLLADKLSVKWMYPFVLLGWSTAGLATGYADRIGTWLAPLVASMSPGSVDPADSASCAYLGFLVCRITLGFFEAGQWPCALITTQRLLSSAERPFGNSVLQSGASIGAIVTPLVVQVLVTDQPGSWRSPYVIIGIAGLAWIGPWLWMVRGLDLTANSSRETPRDGTSAEAAGSPLVFVRRYLALVVVVISINLTWHFFRAWLPKMLQEFHQYEASAVRYFTAAYYIATDVGCLAAGVLVRILTSRGRSVQFSRMAAFATCALLTSLSMFAASQPKGPLLLASLLVIGFGSLGLFPIYYSLTQELSTRHQGKVTGSLSFITWAMTAEMQVLVGKQVDQTGSYANGIFWLGLTPLVGFIALVCLWGRTHAPEGNGSAVSEG
jgi:ACS family hexuronate transporter-like MFS transporter